MSNTPESPNGVVLFADDDEPFRESHASLLRRHGYTCHCAADAASSRKLIGETEIELLIADIHMPGNSALELVESIPQIAPGLLVILLTGRPAVATAARSVRLAVTAYLTKPPDLDELFSLAAQSISNYRRLRAVRKTRKDLQTWAEELAPVEASMGGHPGVIPVDTVHDYLRITVHNLMLQLADLDRSIAAWSRVDPALADLRQLDLVSAIRHTVGVLEKTRQNFKSRELGELRKQLQTLVQADPPKNDPKPAPGPV